MAELHSKETGPLLLPSSTITSSLNAKIIIPGIVEAETFEQARIAMRDPTVEAIKLAYLDLRRQKGSFEAVTHLMGEWLSNTTKGGDRVFTFDGQYQSGAEMLNAAFFNLPPSAARDQFQTFSTRLAEEFDRLLDSPGKLKHNAACFPVWPEQIEKFKPDHLLTFVPHSHYASRGDWPVGGEFPALGWNLDCPIVGAGMRVATSRRNYNSNPDRVLEALEGIRRELSQLEKITPESVINRLSKFWEKSNFDHTQSVPVRVGEVVLVRYEEGTYPGTIHWRMLSEDKHMQGPQVASLNLVYSGGSRRVPE